MANEAELVKKAAGGDMAAFEALVLAYEWRVYNIALRMLGSVQDAEDAVQEVFIKVYGSLASFRGDSKFSVWLYRIAGNVCVDFLRKRRIATVSLSSCDDAGGEYELEVCDESMSPEKVLDEHEQSAALQKALNKLPERYRSVLLLREIAGSSYEDIALTLGLDIGTVKSRIFRARKKLCKILTDDGNFCEFLPSDKSEGGEQA